LLSVEHDLFPSGAELLGFLIGEGKSKQSNKAAAAAARKQIGCQKKRAGWAQRDGKEHRYWPG
jgi:hypothetical protein